MFGAGDMNSWPLTCFPESIPIVLAAVATVVARHPTKTKHRRTCPNPSLQLVPTGHLTPARQNFPSPTRKLLPAPRFYAHLADGNPTIMKGIPSFFRLWPKLGEFNFSDLFFLFVSKWPPFGWSQKSHGMVPQLVWQRCDDPNPKPEFPSRKHKTKPMRFTKAIAQPVATGGGWEVPKVVPFKWGKLTASLPLKRGTATQGTESSSYLKRGIEVPNI